MKKILSCLVIVMLMISMLAGCGDGSAPEPNNNAQSDQEKEEAVSKAESPDTQGMGDLLSASYVEMMKKDKYFMKYKTTTEFNGRKMDYIVTVASSGDKTAIISEGGGINSKIVATKDKSYMIDDQNKMVLVMPIEEAAEDEDAAATFDTEGITYVGDGKEDGLSYEEYTTVDSTIRYYFDGKELVKVSINTAGDTIVMEIIEMKGNVDEHIFDIPSDYQMTSMYGE